MHRSGPLPLTLEGPEQGFRGKNAKMGVGENLGRSTRSRRRVLQLLKVGE